MTNSHNYQIVVLWFGQQSAYKAGKLTNTTVKHDDWCDIYSGGYCNCAPEIWIDGARHSYPSSLLRGRIRK